MSALSWGREDACAGLPTPPWSELLDFADRSSLTLYFGAAANDALPDWVRERIVVNLAENTERLARTHALQNQVNEWLTAAGIPYIFLKGTTQSPHFVADPRLRPQYDLDLFCPPEDARRAWNLLIERGYEPIEKPGDHATDHLPALVRKTGWEWRGGSHFDPEIPLAIEVHQQFWDQSTERLRAPGVEEFWTRRTGHALDTADALGYAALHLLRHLLRGSARACNVYEIAWFLDRHSGEEQFWNRWRELHAPELRRLEAIAFRLARAWFGCPLAPVAEEEVSGLPARVEEWFEAFAFSPLESQFHPNKDELWLHLALLDSARDKLAVVKRRLLPPLPGPVDAVCIPAEQLTLGRRMLKYARTARFLARRAVFHTRALAGLLQSGVRWRMRFSGLSGGYWLFLGASSFFVLGMFIYVLLYNLYLLDLGYREDFVGQVNSASTAGMVAAILPAAALARRWGLGKVLLVSFASVGAISAIRGSVVSRAPLLALAFLSGVAFSLYAVSLAPAIARLTSEKARAAGFSVSTSSSIALGIFGNWLGGHLPGWLGGKRPAMLAGCALVALALWPSARLHIAPAPAEGAKLYPRNRFVVRFLIVWAIWNLATGSFNPFFTTFFARLHTPVERIGSIMSGSQLATGGGADAGAAGAAQNGPGKRHGRHADGHRAGVGWSGRRSHRLGRGGRLYDLHSLSVDDRPRRQHAVDGSRARAGAHRRSRADDAGLVRGAVGGLAGRRCDDREVRILHHAGLHRRVGRGGGSGIPCVAGGTSGGGGWRCGAGLG